MPLLTDLLADRYLQRAPASRAHTRRYRRRTLDEIAAAGEGAGL